MFSRFDTIPECDRQTHTTTAYTALSIASRGKNQKQLAYAAYFLAEYFAEILHIYAI